MNVLPDEMLLEILEKLSLGELVDTCIKVCPQWKDVIAKHILGPKFQNLAHDSATFKTAMEKEEWNEDVNEVEMITSLYQKYEYWSSIAEMTRELASKFGNELANEFANFHAKFP